MFKPQRHTICGGVLYEGTAGTHVQWNIEGYRTRSFVGHVIAPDFQRPTIIRAGNTGAQIEFGISVLYVIRIERTISQNRLSAGVIIPCSRQRSGTGTPLSPCFRIARICGSVNLDFFILVSVDNQRRRGPVFKSLIFGDDYRSASPSISRMMMKTAHISMRFSCLIWLDVRATRYWSSRRATTLWSSSF